MKVDTYLDKEISKAITAINEEQQAKHQSSGKLSASMLGDPLQWQILKIKGEPQAEIDAYTLRKFARGNQVEDWLVEHAPDVIEKQKFVEYRNVVGYMDLLVDGAKWDFPSEKIPVEVKSVTNIKFRRIKKDGVQRGHKLQAGLYALAENCPHFAVSYVASDDLRIHTFVFDTEEIRGEIDDIIDRYDKQLATGEIPEFVAEEKWQENVKYNRYPEWVDYGKEE